MQYILEFIKPLEPFEVGFRVILDYCGKIGDDNFESYLFLYDGEKYWFTEEYKDDLFMIEERVIYEWG